MPSARRFRLLDCTIDRALCRIERGHAVSHVEPRVMDVLVALAGDAGNAMSRDRIIESAWGHPYVTDDALSRCISLLRHALGDDPRKPRFIETIPKRGYRLLAPVEQSGASPARIAVLPFLNLSGTPAYEHVADGLTELVIANLASLPALRVVSRTSSMLYKGSRVRIPDIARQLDVDRIVEGSVFATRQVVQAVMQLIDAATDTHLLSQSYMREVGDAMLGQNDLATAMARDIGGYIER